MKTETIKKQKVIKLLVFFFLGSLFFFGQETIYFESANPFSFHDIITKLDYQESQNVYGILRMPDNFNEEKDYPLIIAVAGSNGWSDHHYEYLKIYRENDIATFELCSFKSRGIESTVGTQTDVTTAMMILDSYRALEVLQTRPNIKPNKIAITGWSLGGGVSLFSAWRPLKNAINKNQSFAAHLSIYPPCIVMPKSLDFGNKPIHILIGELDNWTPSEACVELVEKMNKPNNIGLTIYPNAHHSFDSNQSLAIKHRGYILEDCRFCMNDDGAVIMNFFDIPMTTPLLQKIGLATCAKRGPTYGKNILAKKQALNFAKSFMNQHLH